MKFTSYFLILISMSCGGNNNSAPPSNDEKTSFPFSVAADQSYTEGSRKFGACRDENCSRLHAGVDLYGPVKRPIFAVADGLVLDKHYFYEGTYALVVDHDSFIVRYGEILESIPSNVSVGSTVTKGQHIAYVGNLDSLSDSMLHFERFSGEATGPLTDRSNMPYQRRKDLQDPTQDLLKWPYPKDTSGDVE